MFKNGQKPIFFYVGMHILQIIFVKTWAKAHFFWAKAHFWVLKVGREISYFLAKMIKNGCFSSFFGQNRPF